jgi:arabinogalactan oligomer/maltooligosaccharide transport system permease protein
MYNTEMGIINRGLEILGFSKVDWLGTMPSAFLAVIVANIWLGIPFMMMIFSAALQRIPPELYDAADVDGATGWQKLRHITLPFLKPTAVIASLLGFIWTFNLFNVIWLITGGGPARQTEILVTYVFNEFHIYGQMGTAAAMSVIIFFILLVVSIVYLRISKAMEAWY